jgi:uncharacterized coiled-coil protein SlyX
MRSATFLVLLALLAAAAPAWGRDLLACNGLHACNVNLESCRNLKQICQHDLEETQESQAEVDQRILRCNNKSGRIQANLTACVASNNASWVNRETVKRDLNDQIDICTNATLADELLCDKAAEDAILNCTNAKLSANATATSEATTNCTTDKQTQQTEAATALAAALLVAEGHCNDTLLNITTVYNGLLHAADVALAKVGTDCIESLAGVKNATDEATAGFDADWAQCLANRAEQLENINIAKNQTIDGLNGQISEQTETNSGLALNITGIQAVVDELKANKTAAYAAKRKAVRECRSNDTWVRGNMTAANVALAEEITSLNGTAISLQAKLVEDAANIAGLNIDLNNTLSALSKCRDDSDSAIAALLGNITTLNSSIITAEGRSSAAATSISEEQDKQTGLISDIAYLNGNNTELNNTIIAANSAAAAANTEKASLDLQIGVVQAMLEGNTSALVAANLSLPVITQQAEALSTTKDELQASLDKCNNTDLPKAASDLELFLADSAAKVEAATWVNSNLTLGNSALSAHKDLLVTALESMHEVMESRESTLAHLKGNLTAVLSVFTEALMPLPDVTVFDIARRLLSARR